MMKLVRILLILLPLAAGRLVAQLASPSPLVSERATAQMAPGGWMLAEQRANAALRTGFSSTAAAGYRELLRDPALPGEARQRVTLALTTALLDAAELPAADSVLQGYLGPRNSAYHLRAGLIAIASGRKEAARTALANGRIDDLPAPDRGWWYFLQASVADEAGEFTQANALYDQAMQAAVSALQRARFMLGQEQSRLRAGQVSESQLATLRGNKERFQGTRTGYASVRTYAAALHGLGRTAEAQMELQRQLAVLPPGERVEADQLGLMLGLIAGEGSVAGRQAFRQLLRDGQRPEIQSLALLLLLRGAQKNPAERAPLRRDLTDLIGAPAQHAIIEELMMARAQIALAEKAYAAAEEDARALLERYPGTVLKSEALGVRLAVVWEQKRYRTAADLIVQLRAIIKDELERAELGVLLAEAFFRSEDYRNAADAYAAALHEMPAVAPAGMLIFQRVLSDIRADQLDSAARQLDEAAGSVGFDAESRWQAEWNLVKAMQVLGQAAAAQARVEKLLAGGAAGVPDQLLVRLMWLRARLSFDNNQPETTLRQTEELLALLQKGGTVTEELRVSVTSTAHLLKAQALLALGRDREGLEMLEQLRADFRGTADAQYSYLVQAGHLTQRGDMAGAQRVLISFVDTPQYRQSEYAPRALYDAAINLELQGLDRQLQEAYKLLERLIQTYPQSDYVFYARLKQGDLLRNLNDFASARQLYENLINTAGQHPDILLAQLALADSLFAQGGNSVVNYESASAIFERLRDLPTAPVDLRVEAGFKWGYALARHTQPAKAQTVFWSVVETFLLDTTQAAQLGAKGRYWISRALLELGQIHEDAGRLDEAQRTYQLIIERKLSGATQAQAKLARFGVVRP